MKTAWIFSLAIIGLLGSRALYAGDTGANTPQRTPEADGWKLVWADEFDKDGPPDPRNWTNETGLVRGRQMQWYQAANAWCENGFLVIEGRAERRRNPIYEPGSNLWRKKREYTEYTSASLTTEGLHGWLYGRFEMRARIDTRLGLHPAFWTLGLNDEWPNRGEIDIMEYYRGLLLANAAWGSETNGAPTWNIARTPIGNFDDPDWSHKFHVWRMDWDENNIRLYVDDILLNAIDVTKTFNANDLRKNPFRQPHFLLLDLAIGGHSAGDASKTKFPARFEVDYVRVYQKQPGTPNGRLADVDNAHR